MHSIWLMPDRFGKERFSATITSLSQELGSPLFEPHLTLLGDIKASPEASAEQCSKLLGDLIPSNGIVIGAEGENSYFTSLFLAIKVPQEMVELRKNLIGIFPQANPGIFRPHISLAYGPIAERSRTNLSAKLIAQYRNFEFAFSRISIVSASQSIPVNEWREISSFRLPSFDSTRPAAQAKIQK